MHALIFSSCTGLQHSNLEQRNLEANLYSARRGSNHNLSAGSTLQWGNGSIYSFSFQWQSSEHGRKIKSKDLLDRAKLAVCMPREKGTQMREWSPGFQFLMAFKILNGRKYKIVFGTQALTSDSSKKTSGLIFLFVPIRLQSFCAQGKMDF